MRVNSRGMVRGKYENGICLVKRPLYVTNKSKILGIKFGIWDQIQDRLDTQRLQAAK